MGQYAFDTLRRKRVSPQTPPSGLTNHHTACPNILKAWLLRILRQPASLRSLRRTSVVGGQRSKARVGDLTRTCLLRRETVDVLRSEACSVANAPQFGRIALSYATSVGQSVSTVIAGP